MSQGKGNETVRRPMCALPPRGPAPLPADVPETRAFSIRRTRTKWVNGTVLHYVFLNGVDWDWPDSQKKIVREAFAIWKAIGIGLKFVEVADASEAEISIGRKQDGRSWSYVGVEILKWRDQNRTMNFGWDLTTDWGRATALHEIGHTLGLEHEHQNPLAGIVWDEEAVYAHFASSDGWDRATTKSNVTAKLPSNAVEGSNWDPTSIMHYPFAPKLMKAPKPYDATGVGENVAISAQDAAWARHWYPPTIAETEIQPLQMLPLPSMPGAQANFVFKPTATRDYTVATVGPADSRLVIFEDRDGEARHLASSDDAGTDGNAEFKGKFVSGRTYYFRVRVSHTDADAPVAIALR